MVLHDATRFVRIRDCAAVLPGFSTKGALSDQPNGTHQVVMGKHVEQGTPYIFDERHRLRIVPDSRDVAKYILEPGDILFMSRGMYSYAVLIEDVPDPTIAPSTFFILKPHPHVIPEYLVWCLEQQATEARLNAMRTGAGAPMIPRGAFAEIPIPLPEKSVQRGIAELWRLQWREARLQQELMEEKGRLARLVGSRIFNSFGQADREEP